MRSILEATSLIWVCQDCMLHQANGECGSCHLGEGDDPWSGHDSIPWSLVTEDKVTMGMFREFHSEECRNADDCGCDCEFDNFSWVMCSGCGSNLGGERHAFTLWLD